MLMLAALRVSEDLQGHTLFLVYKRRKTAKSQLHTINCIFFMNPPFAKGKHFQFPYSYLSSSQLHHLQSPLFSRLLLGSLSAFPSIQRLCSSISPSSLSVIIPHRQCLCVMGNLSCGSCWGQVPSDHREPKSSCCISCKRLAEFVSPHENEACAKQRGLMRHIPLASKHTWNLINLSGSPFENFQDKSQFSVFYEIQCSGPRAIR